MHSNEELFTYLEKDIVASALQFHAVQSKCTISAKVFLKNWSVAVWAMPLNVSWRTDFRSNRTCDGSIPFSMPRLLTNILNRAISIRCSSIESVSRCSVLGPGSSAIRLALRALHSPLQSQPAELHQCGPHLFAQLNSLCPLPDLKRHQCGILRYSGTTAEIRQLIFSPICSTLGPWVNGREWGCRGPWDLIRVLRQEF